MTGGSLDIREQVENRPNANGTIDRTRFFGSRVVTLTGKIAIDWQVMSGGRRRRQEVMNLLAPFLLPDARPWLVSSFDDGTSKRIRLRADQFSRPQIANVQDIQMSFKSMTGILESNTLRSERVLPEYQLDGREYDLIFPRRYPPGDATLKVITNEGGMPADWTARIFGPCNDPRVVNVDTEEQVVLRGLRITGANHWIDVSVRDHTVRTDGGASLWSRIAFQATTWWQLPPGPTMVRYGCSNWDPPSAMLFSWRDAFLL